MTEQTSTEIQLPEDIANALKVLNDNPAYAAVVPMLTEKLGTHYALVRTNDKNVARIQESKNTDPKNPDYQDATWRRVAAEKGDPALVKLEAQFQKLEAAREKALAELREMSKAHMQPALSEEETQKLRKLVNDGKSVISDSAKATAAIAEMADQMLNLAGKPVEGGIWSLMPQPESLMNTRGRKAGASKSEGGYATSVDEIKIDGKSSNKEATRKGEKVSLAHFNYAAEALSREFNASKFPGNEVTSEELERAYYDSKGIGWREQTQMPEVHSFEFTKEVEAQNPNDDSTTVAPVTRIVEVTRKIKQTGKVESDSENATDEKKDA